MPAGYREYTPCGRAVLVALLDLPAGATTRQLARALAYDRNTITGAYSLARYDKLIEPGDGQFVWRLTEAGRVFAAMLRPAPVEQPSFTCPRCGATSYNPNDIAHGYCGRCHDYTGQTSFT